MAFADYFCTQSGGLIMHLEDKKLITDFWAIGINYRKSDAALRGQYAVNNQQYEQILASAPAYGITEVFVLSTCNRTEIYGFAKECSSLISLLCSVTQGDITDFLNQAYVKNGNDALSHIFYVSAGLDSQILGDYEIIGQMKQSVGLAREHGMIGQFIDRLFNTTLQSSRAIRSETRLSSGTVSVAYAAVQFIAEQLQGFNNKKILIIGSGKIGQSTCRNLVEKAGKEQITIINRTEEKARPFAAELGINMKSYADLKEHIRESDIIIVATNAAQPVVKQEDLLPSDQKILIDLSIPNNIEAAVKEYPGIILANVDDLSRINDQTLLRRQAEVPKAKALITCYIHEFAEWYMMRQHVPVLRAVKEKLTELNTQLFEARQCKDNIAVQRAVNTMAVKMRSEERRPGCNYIETINDYIAETANQAPAFPE
jgi:glutamyl-tRNA reductase